MPFGPAGQALWLHLCRFAAIRPGRRGDGRCGRIVAEKVPPRSQPQTLRQLGDARVRQVAAGFAAALERGNAGELVALLAQDVTWSVTVLTLRGDRIAEITSFIGPGHFATFGLPPALP